MFLVDTNIWLEVLLEQEQAQEALQFLKTTLPHQLFITEFSLYSIAIILTRLRKDEELEDFLKDLEDSGIKRVCLNMEEIKQTLSVRGRFRLDFDDAYQYVAAERWNLTIVSFDRDFDRTDRGRKTPGEILRDRTNR